MISFDRGGNNLSAVWNEINSIKSDTNSIWNFVSTITGVDVASSIMSSISDITDSLSSVMTDTSSIVSDTAGLNMDVVSLYNFSSVMTSSISDIINSLSTITGGGSGGPYYLDYSDAVNSSLHYVYNMTGDIPSLPYDNINFFGSINNFKNYEIPSISINKFSICANTMEALKCTMSSSSLSNRNRILLSAQSMGSLTFSNLGYINLYATTFSHNTLKTLIHFNANIENYSTCNLENITGTINGYLAWGCSFYSIYGNLNFFQLDTNTFKNVEKINCDRFIKNLFSANYIYDLEFSYLQSNTFSQNSNLNSLNGVYAHSNSIYLFNNLTMNVYQAFSNHVFPHIASASDFLSLNISGFWVSGNSYESLNEVKLFGKSYSGDESFNNINKVEFNGFTMMPYISQRGASIYSKINTFNNVKLLDVHNLKMAPTMYGDSIIGVETMKLNYDFVWTFETSFNNTIIQPTNIYTLDFYNCEDAIGGSTFTIPSFYSGYDEGNVWISGKPLVDYSYTLSVSS